MSSAGAEFVEAPAEHQKRNSRARLTVIGLFAPGSWLSVLGSRCLVPVHGVGVS
ncbi:MAG: hypothetical protein RMJ48_15065 [Roseiflexaceae bacterium]|nr:hypothetical protein [Roseiflexaceae bacterium]